jgi:hypothetical protein
MKAFYLGLIATLCSVNVIAQELASIEEALKLDAEINLDGKVDEQVWKSITPVPLVMHWPTYYGEMTEETEIRIFYDDEYLYVGAIMYDSEPDKIQEMSYR